MTRAEFIAKATRAAERELRVPAGWWGTYRDVHGPNGVRVHFSSGAWTLSVNGERISRHDSRWFAISKGRKVR